MCNAWVVWMKVCVFGGNMSILINGSPTEKICIQRGLKQGDPLAPFIFLLVVKGFSGVMSNAINRSLFIGFEVKRRGTVVSHLQFMDDTLCIGEELVENLWTLKVNYSKSCLIRHSRFMEMACNFLECKEGKLPFIYLGLPVGANSTKLATWEPLLDKLKGILNCWGNKYVSLVGRIVLLIAILNSILIF